LILIDKRIKTKAPSLAQVTGVSWPVAVERFLERALERDLEKRFQTAAEALEAWRRAPAAAEIRPRRRE
jgi:hypothetical protein